jgi:hypothetical protein
MYIIKDIKIFDERLIKFDIKPVMYTFEIIGGTCENNIFNLSNIKDKINIELFYNLPHDLRYNILKHILVNDNNYETDFKKKDNIKNYFGNKPIKINNKKLSKNNKQYKNNIRR